MSGVYFPERIAPAMGKRCQKEASVANVTVAVVPICSILDTGILASISSAASASIGTKSSSVARIYLGAITDGRSIIHAKTPERPATVTAMVTLSLHDLGRGNQIRKGKKARNKNDRPPPCIG